MPVALTEVARQKGAAEQKLGSKQERKREVGEGKIGIQRLLHHPTIQWEMLAITGLDVRCGDAEQGAGPPESRWGMN